MFSKALIFQGLLKMESFGRGFMKMAFENIEGKGENGHNPHFPQFFLNPPMELSVSLPFLTSNSSNLEQFKIFWFCKELNHEVTFFIE